MKTQNGGSGGVVVCMGVGGLVDLSEVLGLDNGEESSDMGGVQVWVFDARRPWNLGNVFGGHGLQPTTEENGDAQTIAVRTKKLGVERGRVSEAYRSGEAGGIIIYDDGDIEEELAKEREAYCELEGMPEVDENEDDEGGTGDSDDSAGEEEGALASRPKKRKSWSGEDEDGTSDEEGGPPRQRRRSNSVGYSHGSRRVTSSNCLSRARPSHHLEDTGEKNTTRPNRPAPHPHGQIHRLQLYHSPHRRVRCGVDCSGSDTNMKRYFAPITPLAHRTQSPYPLYYTRWLPNSVVMTTTCCGWQLLEFRA